MLQLQYPHARCVLQAALPQAAAPPQAAPVAAHPHHPAKFANPAQFVSLKMFAYE